MGKIWRLYGVAALSLVSLTIKAQSQWQYDSVYGGVTAFQNAQQQNITFIRNGVGRHPTQITQTNTTANPTSKVTFTFEDNTSGQRVIENQTVYDGTVLSTRKQHAVFGGTMPMAQFNSDGSINYRLDDVYITVNADTPTESTPLYNVIDYRGSTRSLLDEQAQVFANYGYNIAGKTTEQDKGCSATASCASAYAYPYRFQGHRYLLFSDQPAAGYAAGLLDNQDRFYSHDQGLRFLHTDLANSSVSPYTAYGDDPINFIDVNGLQKVSVMSVLRTWLLEENSQMVYADAKLISEYVSKSGYHSTYWRIEPLLRQHQIFFFGNRHSEVEHAKQFDDFTSAANELFSKVSVRILLEGVSLTERATDLQRAHYEEVFGGERGQQTAIRFASANQVVSNVEQKLGENNRMRQNNDDMQENTGTYFGSDMHAYTRQELQREINWALEGGYYLMIRIGRAHLSLIRPDNHVPDNFHLIIKHHRRYGIPLDSFNLHPDIVRRYGSSKKFAFMYNESLFRGGPKSLFYVLNTREVKKSERVFMPLKELKKDPLLPGEHQLLTEPSKRQGYTYTYKPLDTPVE